MANKKQLLHCKKVKNRLQFEIDTDLMKMKHYLSVKGLAITNEVDSYDFFNRAQEFIDETRNKQ